MLKAALLVLFCASVALPAGAAAAHLPAAKAVYPDPSNYKDFRYHALVIGVDREPVNGSGSTCHVPYAGRLSAFLKKWKCFSGGVVTLKGAEATKPRIAAAISGMRLGPKDVLVIYYGGHGDYAGIMCGDGQNLSPDDLFGYMKRSGAGFNVLLVSACYSGIFSDPDEEWSESPRPKFAVATSAGEDSATTFGEVGFGPYLLKFLKLKYGSAGGVVTLGGLADFIKTENASWKKRGKTRLSYGRNYGPEDSVLFWN